MTISGHVDLVSNDCVIGWVADTEQPGRALEVVVFVDGINRLRGPAAEMRDGLEVTFPGATGNYQFSFEFLPPLTSTRPHTVEVFVRGTQVLIPNGHWDLPASGAESGTLSPIIITSTGRSGTTLLMREFAAQNAIVVADTYPYEVKLASYYASTLAVLTHRRLFTDTDSVRFANLAFREMRAVPNPYNRAALHNAVGGPHLEHLFNVSIPSRLSTLFRDVVLEYYDTVKLSQHKSSVRYFAEKSVLTAELRPATRHLFGRVKEIVLVRDPRDFLCSAKSFWKMSGTLAMNTLRHQISILDAIRQEATDDVLFVRYEDLIFQPLETRGAIYRFLNIDSQEIKDVAPDEDLLRRHATTADPGASIGRWRNDLDAEEATLVATSLEEYAGFMAHFGYDQ